MGQRGGVGCVVKDMSLAGDGPGRHGPPGGIGMQVVEGDQVVGNPLGCVLGGALGGGE